MDHAIPTHNSRIFICFPLLQNKISTPKHGLKALRVRLQSHSWQLSRSLLLPYPGVCPPPQDCLLFPRLTTPSPVAPGRCLCTLCTWHTPAGSSRLAQQVRFPFVGLFQSPSLSQPCSQSTLGFSGYSTSCIESEMCSTAPMGGGHDKGSQLEVGMESSWENMSGEWEVPMGRQHLWLRGSLECLAGVEGPVPSL